MATTSAPQVPNAARPSLRSLVTAAYAADSSDRIIAPAGGGACTTLFGLIQASLAVLRVAAEVEPHPPAVLEWYRRTPIRELGNLPAQKLVDLGRADMVIAFLRAVRDGRRG